MYHNFLGCSEKTIEEKLEDIFFIEDPVKRDKDFAIFVNSSTHELVGKIILMLNPLMASSLIGNASFSLARDSLFAKDKREVNHHRELAKTLLRYLDIFMPEKSQPRFIKETIINLLNKDCEDLVNVSHEIKFTNTLIYLSIFRELCVSEAMDRFTPMKVKLRNVNSLAKMTHHHVNNEAEIRQAHLNAMNDIVNFKGTAMSLHDKLEKYTLLADNISLFENHEGVGPKAKKLATIITKGLKTEKHRIFSLYLLTKLSLNEVFAIKHNFLPDELHALTLAFSPTDMLNSAQSNQKNEDVFNIMQILSSKNTLPTK